MKNTSSFLQFNNTNVLFTSVEGVTYVAIKPICKALNVDYSAQLLKLKNEIIENINQSGIPKNEYK